MIDDEMGTLCTLVPVIKLSGCFYMPFDVEVIHSTLEYTIFICICVAICIRRYALSLSKPFV